MPEIEDLSGRKLGEFVLRARIGEGGFGTVYRCEQLLLGREAVVKVLHPRLRHNSVVLQRFLREAQLASQLDHPGAAHIYAFGIERDDGLFWIAMEMVQGVSLNRWLHEHGAMLLDRFVPFFEQLAEVVHAAHERGIVHRDLKPSNVMVIERAGRLTPKLLDFGVAKLLEGAPARKVPATDALGDAGGDEMVAAAGSNRRSGSPETVTETSSAQHSSGRDLRRLTHVNATVGSPPYMSPEQWTDPAEVGPSSDLYALGVLAYEAITGRRPFIAATALQYAELHCDAPVPRVGGGLPPALDRFFERALAKRAEQRWRTALELAAALRAEWIALRVADAGPAGCSPEFATSGDDETAPYLGLASYAAGDAEQFVGREAEVAAFLERLRTRSLHVVVGPPGAGKSSFVHAGVIPRLPPGWRPVTLRPGAAPLAALAFRLEAAGVAGELRALMASSPAGVAARVAEAAGAGTIVVVVDQLEELFTLGASGGERDQFAAAIAQLAASADLPVRVIATIRDDFLMQLDALPALRPMLSSALVLLGNPLHDDLVRVVVEPARRAGYTLSDPELAHDMVRAVARRPGALALLSFTALRLWELRDRTLRQLTRSAYDAMDGVAGALVRHAEATFEAMSADEQHLAREIFRQLVTADGARAPLSAEELHQRLAAPRSAAVLDQLIAARLIATSEAEPDASGAPRTQVEVIHDALLEAWPRLRGWIRADLDGVRMREQLRVAARQWSDRGRPRGLLWRDDALVDLRRWLRQPRATQLSDLEAAFVEASRRLARLGRVRLGVVAIGFAIAVAVFGYYAMERRIDERALEHVLAQGYADQGETALLEDKFTEALIYLQQAARRGDHSARVQFMLARALQPFQHERARLRSKQGRTWWAMFSDDGRSIVTTDELGAQVWDAETMALRFVLPHGAIVHQAAFTPGGTEIVTAGADGQIKLWDAATGRLRSSLSHPLPSGGIVHYFALAMSPTGAQVAAIGANAAVVHVWDLRTGTLIQELVDDGPAPSRPLVEFSHDGAWLAANAGDGVRVYDTATWNRVLVIPATDIGTLSFDPTGPRLATATSHGDLSIWAIPGGTRTMHLREGGDQVNHVAFSRDGSLVVGADQDGMNRIWNAHSGEFQIAIKAHRSAAMWVEFDPTSRFVISGSVDGEVAISDVTLQMRVSVLGGPSGRIYTAHFDPRARQVIAASWDGNAWVWDTTWSALRWATPPVGRDCASTVRPESDRRFVAVACAKHSTFVWDTQGPDGPRLLGKFPSPTPVPGDFTSSYPVVDAAGEHVAIAVGNLVHVYELGAGRLVDVIHHDAPVTTIAFATTGHDLVTGSIDGALRITQDRGSSTLAELPAAVDVAAFLPDGRVVASDAQLRLHVFDPMRRAPVAELKLPGRVTAFRSSSDSSRLLTIPAAAIARPPVLWDLQHYRQVTVLEAEHGPIFSARFSQDDTYILTPSTSGTTRAWDAVTGRLRTSYFRSAPFLTDAALDPTGTFVVTAGGDGVLRFWDTSSGHVLWTLKAHQAAVAGLHFEGTDLVTRGFTGEIARWRLSAPPSAELDRVVDRVVRCLSLRFDDETRGMVEQDPRCGT